MIVGGALTISGVLRANGQAATSAGGGSGGAILLVSGGVAGGGSVTANGGNGTGFGGGGGGRIASYSPPGTDKLPGGTKTVNGGTGAVNGSPGTIYTGDAATSVDFTFSVDGRSFGWDANGVGTLKAVVLNQGPTASDSVRVAVYDRDPALPGAVELGTMDLPGLPAHGAYPVEFTIHPVAITDIWVMADADNTVAEFDETNNKISLNATRINTSLYVPDRTGTITENVALRGYLKRLTDNAWLPGRTVKFYVEGSYVGSAVTGADGKAELIWTITDGLASRVLQGKYAGETDYNPSQGTATLTCQSWTTKMVSFNRTARITDRTELKARLLRSDNVPLYNKGINFYVDGTFVITRPTNVDGYASYPNYVVPDGAGEGTRTILSEWPGNGGYAAVSKTATLTVNRAIAYIWVLPKTIPQGAIANLYAYFRRLYDYQKQTSKTVDFKIDGTVVQTVITDANGVARHLYHTTEPPGVYRIRCEFYGDAWLDPGYGEANLTIY